MHARRVKSEVLRRLIAERDMSKRDFARAVPISYRHLLAVQAGQKRLSERMAVRMARVLGVPLEDFTEPDPEVDEAA